MKFTPNSTAWRSTERARARSFGGPHTPSPVMRMAPKPRRCTFNSPSSEKLPLRFAETDFTDVLISSPWNDVKHSNSNGLGQKIKNFLADDFTAFPIDVNRV